MLLTTYVHIELLLYPDFLDYSNCMSMGFILLKPDEQVSKEFYTAI